MKAESQKDNKQVEKEDYLSPTKIEHNNKTPNEDIPDPNLSHTELKNRLDLYSQVGGQMDHYFKVQEIKLKYEKELNQLEDKRTKSDIHYAQGLRSGLPHSHYDQLKEMRERYDQEIRNEIAKEAKDYYKEKNSLSKSFKEDPPEPSEMKKVFNQRKDRGLDRNI